MAYYDYFKNIKPVYALPSYGGVQGGRQARALGIGRYKPYSEVVREQARRLPAYYALAQQKEWQAGIGEQAQEAIDIQASGLELAEETAEKQQIWQEEQDRLNREEAKKQRQLEWAGFGIAALPTLYSGATAFGTAMTGGTAAAGAAGTTGAAAGTLGTLGTLGILGATAYSAWDAWRRWQRKSPEVVRDFVEPLEFSFDTLASEVFGTPIPKGQYDVSRDTEPSVATEIEEA